MTAVDGQVWRLFELLLQQVRDGVYGEGDPLPSEAELARLHGVSRSTAGRVMWLLRWIGLVVGPAGVAGRVAAEPSRSLALQLVERAFEIRRLNGDDALLGADPHLLRDCSTD